MEEKVSAFTLIELLIVVVIVGIIVSIGLVRYAGTVEKARSAEAYSTLSQIVAAEQAYYAENNSYTADFTDLDIFESKPLSDNFTYSIPSTDTTEGYAQAARKSDAAGRLSYGMCLKSGKKASCSDDACDPDCT